MLIIDNALDTAIEITENHILVIEGKEAIEKAKERQTIRLKRLIYGESEARNKAMKAYLIREVNGVYDYAAVVFAETRNKAKVIGMNAGPFEGSGLDYMDVEARRIPKLDKYYRGLDEMDWDNNEDRIAMVKDGNFSCSYEFEPDDCETCPARQWCDRY